MVKRYQINVSVDKEICAQCGKKGVGFFEAMNAPGKFICGKCVEKNIDRIKPQRPDSESPENVVG